jgi:hypothetical protein
MTARPPRVFMRTKKPWVRARRVFEGWYVRFIRLSLRLGKTTNYRCFFMFFLEFPWISGLATVWQRVLPEMQAKSRRFLWINF